MNTLKNKPNYVFEVSWEVCNKVGGIHTVISTKAKSMMDVVGDNLIMIGPDLSNDNDEFAEFIEDKKLFADWKQQACRKGLRVRTGKWNVAGHPNVILVDFSELFEKKDEIFTDFWNEYQLDSISGQWDYIEPVLFGNAVGRVIEDFYDFYVSDSEKVVAHFHEWMTGSGLLYLKKNVPQVAGVFTTHATVLGRSIAGNGQALYSELSKYDGDTKAKEFNVISKQSLEKISAQQADCFTTVSEITATECEQFLSKKPNLITPNGFEDSFVPDDEELKLRRVEARVAFFEIAEALLAYEVPKDSGIVITSGRYEYKNKGIDLFIEALSELNANPAVERNILAFIMVPASHHGPRRDVFKNLQQQDDVVELNNTYLTHYLNHVEQDPVLNKIAEVSLLNKPEDKVKVFFVPSYLDGNDGLFNRPYYDLLAGADLSVFASYYEPWGYTPLESLAFHIPTVTTSLAGFGKWTRQAYPSEEIGVKVVKRDDYNDKDVVHEIASKIARCSSRSEDEKEQANKRAWEVSRSFLWKNFVEYYFQAYDIALAKAKLRVVRPRKEKLNGKANLIIPSVEQSVPSWKRIIINQRLPKSLKPLEEIANNLWWSWTPEAIDLFESIHPEIWEQTKHNATEFLNLISLPRLQQLEKDGDFIGRLSLVHKKFLNYMKAKDEREGPKVAYFSMEFGLHQSLKIYSGGLGILAGDYLKEASDQNVNMVGIGLLYRYGYFNQRISTKGHQIAAYDPIQFSKTPAKPVRDKDGTWKTISIGFPGRKLHARIWQVNVGRIELYLLDTDFEENLEQDRGISHQLYGGDEQNRIKQEILLGIGGIKALRLLGVDADVFHCNEGHAAFIGLERLRHFINMENLSFSESLEVVRSSTLFTTHTPVPAGHDSFTEDLVRRYLSQYPEFLQISWQELLALGRLNPNDSSEKFSMSYLAANMSQEINGVSKLHGEVSREIFSSMYPGHFPEELHIGYVTNGVHYQTWASSRWRKFFLDKLGDDFEDNLLDFKRWEKIQEVSSEEIWNLKKQEKKDLINYINTKLDSETNYLYHNPKHILEIKESLAKDALIIGFARRFATYKRAHLLFRDLQRLSGILNVEDRPVIFLFAGKAHPNDGAGQDLIRNIVEISNTPGFVGKVVFLQDYDIQLAKHLVQGVDVWLNTPTRPLEASGTSGQKVLMNGGLNFSVLDGWWLEGYVPEAGWQISEKRTYEEQDLQDELDAEIIYATFENELIPLFFNRNEKNVPEAWVQYMKNSISYIAPHFTTARMLDDYRKQYYNKLGDRKHQLIDEEYAMTEQIVDWKKNFYRQWEGIEVMELSQIDISKEQIYLGEDYDTMVKLHMNGMNPEDVGLELVFSDVILENKKVKLVFKKDMELIEKQNGHAVFKTMIKPHLSGAYDVGIRMYPKKEFLPHKQDFNLVKWL